MGRQSYIGSPKRVVSGICFRPFETVKPLGDEHAL